MSSAYASLVHSIASSLYFEHSGEALPGSVPTSSARQLIDDLLTVRATSPPDELADDVERLLRLERRDVVDAESLPAISADVPEISIWRGDITLLNADFIVNAANSSLLGCFQPRHKCIDNVIHAKAGPRLRACCQALMEARVPEPVGSCRVTPGFALSSKHVLLHTVGPQVPHGNEPTASQRAELKACYLSCLDAVSGFPRAESRTTVAFPCISTGVYGYPQRPAAEAAVEAVREWLDAHPDRRADLKIIFNTYLTADHEIYCALLGKIYNQPIDPANFSSEARALAAAAAALKEADYLLVSGGAGLSASAGLDYGSEEVFKRVHPTMHRLGFRKMYQFIGYDEWSPSLQWGYFFMQTLKARFNWTPTAPTYAHLKSIYDRFKTQDAFIITSNADGMFEQTGFPTDKIYTRQGDYSRIQCMTPCRSDSVWPFKPLIEASVHKIDPKTYELAAEAVPRCPNCGGDVMLNVNGGRWFLETELEPQKAAYRAWLKRVVRSVREEGKRLAILEVGAGFNTPGVLRYPNESLASELGVTLVRINLDHSESETPSHCISVSGDATSALEYLSKTLSI